MSTPHLEQYLRANPTHEVKYGAHPINRYKAMIVSPDGTVHATVVEYSIGNCLHSLDVWAQNTNPPEGEPSDPA